MNKFEKRVWAAAYALSLNQYRSSGFASSERTRMAVGEADEAVILMRARFAEAWPRFHIFDDLEVERKAEDESGDEFD